MQSHWTQGDLLINGALLHYVRTGNGSLPPLVLVHGFSGNGLCYQASACDLESQFDVVMPDARGHGLSARVQPGEKTDMTADLAGIIQALGLKHPIVAGHSMGGQVVGQLGARFPQLVRALILEDPAWFLPEPLEENPPLQEDSPVELWIKGIAKQNLEEVMAKCRADHPTWPEIAVLRWCEGKKQLDPNFFRTHDDIRGNWTKAARAIACPTLLITADVGKGAIITPETAQVITEMNSFIRVARIAGAGHHVRFENYPAYMDAVRGFLKEIAAV